MLPFGEILALPPLTHLCVPSWMDLACPSCLDHVQLHNVFCLVVAAVTNNTTKAGVA